jgi:TPR repeat protein
LPNSLPRFLGDHVVKDFEKFVAADKIFNAGRMTEAFKRFLHLAEKGDTSAMTRVALMYEEGQGTARDVERSVLWNMKASKLGNTTGMFNLAIHHRGLGNSRLATALFEKALEGVDDEAALELAKMFLVSDLETGRVENYLRRVLESPYVSESSREEALVLLDDLEKGKGISPSP